MIEGVLRLMLLLFCLDADRLRKEWKELFDETSYRAEQEERKKTGGRGEEGVVAVLRPCVGGTATSNEGELFDELQPPRISRGVGRR